MKQKIAHTLRIVILSLILSATIGYSLADWAPPTGNPPLGNVPPPINVGPATQEKAGNLVLSGPTGTLIAKNGFFSNALGINVPSIMAGKRLDVNGDVNVGDTVTGTGEIFMAGSANNFYGDSVNLAARQAGAFYVQNAAGTALGPLNAGAIGATKVTAGTAAGQGFCLGPTNCITAWPINSAGTYSLVTNLSMNNRAITSVTDPVGLQDAATKNYVDTQMAAGGGGTFTCQDFAGTSMGWAANTSHTGQEICNGRYSGSWCVSAMDISPGDGSYAGCNDYYTQWEDDIMRCCKVI